jgi:hypothetical protein
MHHHNHDTHCLIDSEGNLLPTSGSLEEIRAEALYIQSLGHGPVEIIPIGQPRPWQWDLIDWGD